MLLAENLILKSGSATKKEEKFLVALPLLYQKIYLVDEKVGGRHS
jgi:hypothetical protein